MKAFTKLVELTKQIETIKTRLNVLESIDTDEANKEYEKKVFAKMQLVNERGLVFKQYIKTIGVKYTDQQATKKVWQQVYAKCK